MHNCCRSRYHWAAMNKHTREKYPHAVREIVVYEDAPKAKPQGIVVSLFDETVQRAAKAEAALAEANKRIAALEKALKASRDVNALAIKRAFASDPIAVAHAVKVAPFGGYKQVGKYLLPPDVNGLSDDDVERMMSHAQVPDDYVNETTVERPETPWRAPRVLAPLCALFRRAAQ